jgi:HSP20 family protein
MPPVNLHETDTHVVVDVELPGLESEDVDISVHDNTLTIKGEKKSEHEEGGEGKSFYRYERSYGSFQRRVPLPCAVETEGVEAKLDKGVLHLSMPKHKENGAKKIGVKSA